MKALIVGSSSGIGLCTAKLLLQNNWEVTGASRSTNNEVEFPQFVMDVRNSEEITEILDKVGQIDALIYSAGIGMASPAAETTRKDYLNLFDVNFFGLCEVIKYALPKMQENGRIIAVSSIAGVLPVPFNSFYSASKAAVNAYIMSLESELKPRKIYVSAVLPGGVRTEFSKKRKKYSSEDDVYSSPLESSINEITDDEQDGMKPEKVAAEIYNILTSENPPIIYPIGMSKAYYLMDKVLPKKITNKILTDKYTH